MNRVPPKSLGTETEFGEEWHRYPEILPQHEEQFLSWIQPMGPSDFIGKSVLDAGCGIGRNSYWALRYGASHLVAFDFDQRTVEVARRNLKEFSQATVEYQSIYSIPFREQFDIVFCIGVVHHLQDPRRAVARLTDAVKPGGTLVLWVYGREGLGMILRGVLLLRFLTRGLSIKPLIALSRGLSVLLKLALVWPWKKPYLLFLRSLTRRHLEAIILDQLIPSIAHYWSKEQALSLIDGTALRLTHITPTRGMSWTILATKPLMGS